MVIIGQRGYKTRVLQQEANQGCKTSQTGITVHGHRGSGTTHTYGHVPGIKDRVWIDEDGIANVLALCLIRQQYRVTYDNWNEACFLYTRTTEIKSCSRNTKTDSTTMTPRMKK